MSKTKITVNSNALVNAILYIVIGILFIAFRAGLLNVLLTIVGALFILAGAVTLIQNKKVDAVSIIEIILGIVIIVCGWTILDVTLLIFGILILIESIYQIFMAIKANDSKTLIYSIVTAIVGVLLIVSKWYLVDWIFIVIGVIFILDGIVALITYFKK